MARLANPTALIAWAQRDPQWTDEQADSWRDELAAFATALRRFGVDAEIDLHNLSRRGMDWTRFGPKAIVDKDWVVVALSPAWRDRWEGTNAPSIGAGAVAEADALRSVFAEDQQAFRDRVVLVTLPSMLAEPRLVPTGLHGVQRRRISGFELADMADLLRLLTGQDAYPPPPLGEIPALPPAVAGPIGGVTGLEGPIAEGAGETSSAPRTHNHRQRFLQAAGLVLVAMLAISVAAVAIRGRARDVSPEGIRVLHQVRFPFEDRSRWRSSVDVRPGDAVEWKIEAHNRADTKIEDLVLSAARPRGAALVKDSVRLYTSDNPRGVRLEDGGLDNGYDVGNYLPNSNVVITYATTLPDRMDECVVRLGSAGYVRAQGVPLTKDLAEVRVRRTNCPPMDGFWPPRRTFKASCKDPTRLCGSADGPVFNSFVHTKSYGDERAFLDARRSEDTSKGSYADELRSVNVGGRRLVLRMFVNNNADPETNKSGRGIARNTRVRLELPRQPSDGVVVHGFITAANAKTVSDSVSLAGELPFKLRYRRGSAVFFRKNRAISLSDSIVTTKGAKIGVSGPDGNLPGGFKYALVVEAEFDVIVV